MKRVIIHPGLFKAGSTLVQKVSEHNEDALLRNGVALWSHTHDSRSFHFHCDDLGRFEAETHDKIGYHDGAAYLRQRIAEGRPAWARALARYLTYHSPLSPEQRHRLREAFTDAFRRSGADTLFITSEMFSAISFSLYGRANNLRAASEDLVYICSEFPVTFIIVLRGQAALLLSLYNQIVKGNFISEGFREWLIASDGMHVSALQYDEMLSAYAGLVGGDNLKVLFFEDILKGERSFLQGIFCNFVNPDALSLSVDPDWKNISLSPVALEITRYANALIKTEAEKSVIARAMLELTNLHSASSDGRGGADVESETLLALFKEGNRRLFEVLALNEDRLATLRHHYGV